jgi:hypothetical protein
VPSAPICALPITVKPLKNVTVPLATVELESPPDRAAVKPTDWLSLAGTLEDETAMMKFTSALTVNDDMEPAFPAPFASFNVTAAIG